jgi:hypothetical protein
VLAATNSPHNAQYDSTSLGFAGLTLRTQRSLWSRVDMARGMPESNTISMRINAVDCEEK